MDHYHWISTMLYDTRACKISFGGIVRNTTGLLLTNVVGNSVVFYFLVAAMGLRELAEEISHGTVWLVCMFFSLIRTDMGRDSSKHGRKS